LQGSNKPITLITGASRGIGRFLAEHYLDRGHVVLGVSRGEVDLSHADFYHFAVDVRDEKAVRSMFDQIARRFGSIQHLINNAGVSSLNHAMLTSLDSVKNILDINFVATFLFCQEAARLMRGRKFGRIVNFSTISVPLRTEGVAAYAASKAAIEMLTRILAKELGPLGITVNCLGPSTVDTDLARGIPRHRVEELIRQQAIRREAQSADVANVVDFFLSDRSEMVSAQVIYLGGFG
jgi:3-oxoacyl-[acyl-carrier protein] reductase